MAIEGHRDGAQPALPGHLNRSPDHGLMAPVDAVEEPDGHGRRTLDRE
jgi:hypothetical protein